jgi:hypothetical protein
LRPIFFALAVVVFCYGTVPANPAQGFPAARPFFAQSSSKQSGCELFYILKPFDPSILQLLGSPVGPSSRSLFTNPSYVQLRNWDFPSKVTPWTERPSPEEIERRRQELAASSSAGAGSKGKSKNASAPEEPAWVAAPYSLELFSSKDWSELEKWFAKEGPKKVSGLCVNQEQAGYVLAVGLLSDGSGDRSLETTSARIQYDQSTRAADTSVGPNSGTVTVGGTNRPAQELSGMSSSSRPGTHTCVYLFRTREPGGARRETPDYYYCQSSDEVPRATITAMLKYLAKSK